MLTLEDCIAFSGLTDDQVEAVAKHQHMNVMLAAEFAECLLEKPNGCHVIASILADEAASACARGQDCASRYAAGLADFRRLYRRQLRV